LIKGAQRLGIGNRQIEPANLTNSRITHENVFLVWFTADRVSCTKRPNERDQLQLPEARLNYTGRRLGGRLSRIVNFDSIRCSFAAERTGTVHHNHVRVGKPPHYVVLMHELSIARGTLGIRSRTEVAAARTRWQRGRNAMDDLHALLTPSALLVCVAVNHVGTSVAVKMRPAIAHATRTPCVNRVAARPTRHRADPPVRNWIMNCLHACAETSKRDARSTTLN
jgi:hypothetical protein